MCSKTTSCLWQVVDVSTFSWNSITKNRKYLRPKDRWSLISPDGRHKEVSYNKETKIRSQVFDSPKNGSYNFTTLCLQATTTFRRFTMCHRAAKKKTFVDASPAVMTKKARRETVIQRQAKKLIPLLDSPSVCFSSHFKTTTTTTTNHALMYTTLRARAE